MWVGESAAISVRGQTSIQVTCKGAWLKCGRWLTYASGMHLYTCCMYVSVKKCVITAFECIQKQMHNNNNGNNTVTVRR